MFAEFYGQMMTTFNAFMDDKYQNFIEAFKPLAVVILTIYIIIVSWILLTGRSEKGKELFITVLLTTFISGIVFSYGVYKSWIMDTILFQSFKIQGFFLTMDGSLPSHFFSGVDKTFELFYGQMGKIWEGTSILSSDGTLTMFVIIVLSVIFGALYMVYAVLVIFSTFAIFVFFVIGGIPLFLAIIPKTRFIFYAWLRAILNYALIPIFAAIVMAISIKFLNASIEDLMKLDIRKNGVLNLAVGNAMFIGVLAIFFHLKAPEFAAALTGGQPSGVGGFFTTSFAIAGTSFAIMKSAPKYGKMAGKGAWGASKLGATGLAYSNAVLERDLMKGIQAKNNFSKSRGV